MKFEARIKQLVNDPLAAAHLPDFLTGEKYDNCDLDHCRGLDFIVLLIKAGNNLYDGGADEKAGLDSRTYSHVKEARTQKNGSRRNRAEIEENRGGNATKSL
jgi:hypothetical protein